MHFHWQNLNDDKTRPRWGGGRRHGRAWLHFGPNGRNVLGWSWAFFWPSSSPAVSFSLDRADGVGMSAHLAVWPIFSFFIHWHGGLAARIATRLLPKRYRDAHSGQWHTDYGDRDVFNIRIFDWAIWWTFWRDPMGSWSRKVPRWREGNCHPIDFIFGHTKVTDKEIARKQVMIPMPERSYSATVVIEDRVWRRPRWPLPWHHHIGAHVHMERDPIPHPGKGENSYDCGEDATYSSSFPIPRERFQDAVSYAVGHVVASALDLRRRYGGRDWRPTEDHRPKDPPPLAVVKPA